MGYWRDLKEEYQVETSSGYFTLPHWADSLIKAAVNGYPVNISARWQDYSTVGITGSVPASFGIVDDGYRPTLNTVPTLPATEDYSAIWILPQATTVPVTNLPTTGTVTISFTRTNGTTGVGVVTLNGQSSVNLAGEYSIKSVEQIVLTDVPSYIRITAVQSISALLAIARGDTTVRYRRYRVSNDSNTVVVSCLLKRAYEPVLTNADVVYLANLNAIKHALLAMTAEDNADLERAQYHWSICKQLLEEEIDTSTGPAKPKLTIDPFAGASRMQNML